MNITDIGIHDSLERLQRGECTAVELTDAVLAAIRERDEDLNAYISVDEADARAQAEAADAARAKGATGSLLGVPIAIKDILNVNGQPCGCASRMLESYVSPYDATAIARLRDAGAIFVGRTNMDEFAMGSSTENSAFGPTRNPHNLDYVPGGSSGGSAAAVAGGEAIAAIGTDTGGSIRQPASFCGCVGLKPSYGRVSRYGLTAYASSLDQIGPLTRNVRDAALLLQAMAGVDPLDATSVDEPVPDYSAALSSDLNGMTLGLPREYFVEGLDADVESAVREAIRVCEGLG
ncbi:MAG: amidase, partial [Kiritimatiellae bacterium]|nr:amidase [Kiritimatiellia bacterium]